MNILFVIHATFEKPGSIETWAKRHNHNTHEVKPYAGEYVMAPEQLMSLDYSKINAQSVLGHSGKS